MTLLRAYEATGEKDYLDAAVAAANCLAWGQLASGGWTYSIEFDLARNRNRYHHLDPKNTLRYEKLRNVTTFDDNTTQSAMRLLMAVDQYVDDSVIDAARQRGFTPSKLPHNVYGLGTQPANLLGVTTDTKMTTVSFGSAKPWMNCSFYRIVALDANDVASGPSAMVELPHLYIYSQPVETATVGSLYRYEPKSLACLGDL